MKLEPRPPVGDMAIIGDTDTTRWKQDCQIRQVCPEPVRKVPRCARAEQARTAREVLEAASSLAGQIVRVRGGLAVGEYGPRAGWSLVDTICDPAVGCCRRLSAPVVVGDDDHALTVDRMRCTGDESRICCNAPAYGQTVVVTGRLRRVPNLVTRDEARWYLADARACEDPSGGPDR